MGSKYGATGFHAGNPPEADAAYKAGDLMIELANYYEKDNRVLDHGQLLKYGTVHDLPVKVLRRLAGKWKIPLRSQRFSFVVNASLTNIKHWHTAQALGGPAYTIPTNELEAQQRFLAAEKESFSPMQKKAGKSKQKATGNKPKKPRIMRL